MVATKDVSTKLPLNYKMAKNSLQLQLDEFIKAYYNNRIRKGCLVLLIVVCSLFAVFSLLEYFSYFPSWIRGIFFYGFIAMAITVLVGWILIPLFKKQKWIKGLSYKDAAVIIGRFFPEIDDKLLNAIELQEMTNDCDKAKLELLQAGIEEKTILMKKFHFPLAIDWQSTRKYIKYAAVLLLAIVILFAFNNELFTKPTNRIIHYSQYFEKPAPYHFYLKNDNLQAFENENFTIEIVVNGEEMPEEAFIHIDQADYRLQADKHHVYSFEFKNLQANTSFYIHSEEVRSQDFEIKVLPKPILISFSVELDYPAYTGKPNETLENNGDMFVPQGTHITWLLNSRNTESIIFRHDATFDTIVADKDKSQVQLKAMQSQTYCISNLNKYLQNKDSLSYAITVIPDIYPDIEVTAVNDSAFLDRFYFKGTIKDDYGFQKLNFVYLIKEDDKEIRREIVPIPIQTSAIIQDFYHYFDAQTLNMEAGQSIEYYFEVFDNDAVNGSKSTKSTIMEFHLPSENEMREQNNQTNLRSKNDIDNILKNSEKILKEIEELKKKMVDQQQPTWQEKRQLEELLKQLQDLKKEGENLVNEQKRQEQINEQYNTLNEEILEKQKELQRRFDELFNDEMKSMMQEIQQMMNQNLDKNKFNQMLEKVQINTEELNKQLDQNLELFKQMEIDSRLDNAMEKSHELAEKEKELMEKNIKNQASTTDLQQEQQKLNEAFKNLQSELNDINQLNQNLEDPYNLDPLDSLSKEIAKDMQQAQQDLNNGKRESAAKHQKDAALKLEEMTQSMQSMMNEEEQQSLGEDIHAVRQILDNIIKASFSQEEIIKQLSKINTQDPAMRNLIQQQHKLKDQLRLIEDSISAVARRQINIQPFVTKQVTTIKQAEDDILKMMSSTQEPSMRYYYGNNSRLITSNQQFVMKSLNELGLMLAESLEKMQEQQKSGQGQGSGNCSSNQSPGGKKNKSGKSAKSMRELQEKLNQQLQEMRKQMQEGKTPNPNSQNPQSMSEQFARMAAQQEAIRRMLQDYQSELKKNGQGYDGKIDKMLKEMEQTERDLVNKILNQQTIDRQQRILTRLLESEKAELQREKEEKRESKTAQEKIYNAPPEYIQEELQKKKEIELYKTVPPTLNQYYRNKVNQYFYQFEKHE